MSHGFSLCACAVIGGRLKKPNLELKLHFYEFTEANVIDINKYMLSVCTYRLRL